MQLQKGADILIYIIFYAIVEVEVKFDIVFDFNSVERENFQVRSDSTTLTDGTYHRRCNRSPARGSLARGRGRAARLAAGLRSGT
jgi:hypothetical protein